MPFSPRSSAKHLGHQCPRPWYQKPLNEAVGNGKGYLFLVIQCLTYVIVVFCIFKEVRSAKEAAIWQG